MHAGLKDFRMPSVDAVDRAAAAFRLVSDPTRIRLLWAMLQGESSVACLAELVGGSPAAVSQHLAKLRLAGAVKARRRGAFVYYDIADPYLGQLLTDSLGEVGAPPQPAARGTRSRP